MKYVVVGGIAGGPSFATRLSRIDAQAEIVLLEQNSAISVASCAIPYYLSGVIKQRDQLIERTPEILKEKNNIDVRLNNQVTAINPDDKQVMVLNQLTGEKYAESYDRLILATGARPTLPKIPGIDSADNAFVLRSLTQADQIKEYLDNHEPKSVIIVGAGTIGLELAESFKEVGMDITIVEQSEQIAAPFDSEITDVIKQELSDQGVRLLLNQTITSIEDNGHKVVYSGGSTHNPDMIFLGTGIQPNSKLAQEAGIKVTEDGHIPVDDHFKTNVEDIYAIGDVIQTTSLIDHHPINSLLSSAANRQGHLLADILNGEPFKYKGFIGTGATKIFNLTASFVGYTEQELIQRGATNYKTVFITPYDHAYFYPDADRVNLKLIFENGTGKILGGQAVGRHGVDKRISQLSVAITGNLSVYDLPALEIPYSPPYSSTRDILNIAGYVAINQLSDRLKTIKLSDIPMEDYQNAVFLDIREKDKKMTGTINPTIHIPLSELRARIKEIPADKQVYITFRPGLGAYNASRILAGNGINAIIIEE
ncbi:FAD-dependent oxidoreductase [Lentilactobacillus sp. SPB1-3]|uniref:FAD-dependent oxidoreductase n=1 Tax=Lentilactobacillus terminaliae TaxID=3003483 RepID=A0ACD5DFM5_9LACO|nr:FAD-dependent oxidoreductase [Lentilactobacillus sp. SPB1-3]MCZ0976610.1 FAD-dependent oxidoreductase [Lentilactobacillus sp. SPB1-3]